MKRLSLLLAILLALIPACIAETADTAAQRVWHAVAEAGGGLSPDADYEEDYGLYCFSEFMQDGYMTMTLDPDDPQRILGPVSLRIYPAGVSEIEGRFFPMLSALLEQLLGEPLSAVDEIALAHKQAAVVNAFTRAEAFDEELPFNDACAMKLSYSANYNELYVLLTPAADTEIWRRE